MDTKINFFKIGIFILIFILMLLAVIFWLGKYGFEKKKFDEYSIYFKESVSGLNVGSAIKYKGFEVGNVNEIKINPNNSEEIELNILIQKGTPIKEDNYAILGNLGITGLKYIELKGGTNDSALLKENESGIKIIQSKTSDLVSLFDSTQDITQEFMLVLNQIKKVLDDKNIDKFSKILSKSENSAFNIEQLSEYLVKNEKKIDLLLKDISTLVKTSNESFVSVNKSANSFKELSKESFDKLNKVLNSLDETLIQTQNLVNEIEQSPSDLIFKQKSIKYGPGEINEK